MSFGGKSFKKQLFKKELEQIAKKSQEEFSTLPATEKDALRQKSKTNAFERPKKKKKILQPHEEKDEDILAATPSVDLEAEFKDVDFSYTELPFSEEAESKRVAGSAKVASIKSYVDLNVVMQGRKLEDKQVTGPVTATSNSKASQRSSGKSPSARRRPFSSRRAQLVSTPPVNPLEGTKPKPAIISSQNSTMQIQLSQRPTPKPVIITSRPISIVSDLLSGKQSHASLLSEHSDEYNIIVHDDQSRHVLIPQVEQTDPNDKGDENETEDEKEREIKDEREMEQKTSDNPLLSDNFDDVPPEEDDQSKGDRSPIPLNASDIIHSEIQLLTKSLMSQDSSIINLLQSYDADKSAENIAAKNKEAPSNKNLASPSYDNGFVGTPITPKKLDSKIFEKKHDVSERSMMDPKTDAKGTPPTREWPGLVSSELKQASQTSFTSEEALKILELPLEIKSEDIICIRGTKTQLNEPDISDSQENMSWLGSWNERKVATNHNVHHFCTMATTMEISPQMHLITRDTHTPDRLHFARQRYYNQEPIQATKALVAFKDYDEREVFIGEKPLSEERRLSIIANRILEKAMSGETDDIMKKLKAASDQLFQEEEEKDLQIEGVKIDVKDDSSRLYWTPAPPKMGLAPETIRTHLYPEYQGGDMLKESIGPDQVAMTTIPESDDDEDDEDWTGGPDHPTSGRRFQDRAHRSLSDLSQIKLTDDKPHEQSEDQQDDSKQDENIVRFESLLDKRRQQIKEEKQDELVESGSGGDSELEEYKDGPTRPFRRAQSEPMLSFEKEKVQLVSNYDVSMKELEYQLNAVAAAKQELQTDSEADDETEDVEAEDEVDHEEQSSTIKDVSTLESLYSHSLSTELTETASKDPTDGDETRTELDTMSIATATSKQTTINLRRHRLSIPRGKLPKRHPKKKTKISTARQKKIKEFVDKPPNTITRSTSFCNLLLLKNGQEPKQDIQESLGIVKTRSVNDLQSFENFIDEESSEPIDCLFDWVRDNYWYNWFDEVYPPSTVTPELRYDFLSVTTPRATTSVSKSTSGAVIDNAVLYTIQVIKPEMQDTDQELYQRLLDETENLTKLIENTEKKETLAVFLCRRGAIYRKIGELKKAWEDLNESIKLESLLLDAYWHRHLLHLLQNNKKAALDDVTFIIKNNGSSARAFRSRAELYREQGDATMAIINYSQAIKLNPNDVETYYQRANMFKLRGDMLLALEDYNNAAKLLPSRTDAKFEVGKYHFDHENWNGAINDFNAILQQDPVDALAYTYRGRVFQKMGQFENALRDFAAAIHYDPDSAVALYHRACILRKINPRRALQDLSVSLLLDSSVDNVNAYLHRGILYTDLKRWEDAIPDFESALELDPNLACARVNIGLIYIIKYNNHQRAIRQYTSAIHVDPTYFRARICRAEAYQHIGMLQEAVMDYTHVIHIRPDVPDYHMARGKILLEQNKMDLASYHVKQAAKLNQGLGASPTQQAVVQSFLSNFDVAIDVLNRATRVNPSAPLFILLGKTNMKAKKFLDAIESFKKAIEVMTPWHSHLDLPKEAAVVYYLMGLCYSELFESQFALDAFNSAIKVNPEFSEAFYQRGLTKMRLRQTRGIHDFNRALAINPKLFQAFLSRAAYYGMKHRYSKGIMSCNEAIKLQPKSVRAYLYRGALKFHIHAYGLAVKDLTEAVAIDCRCSLAYFNRAVCYHGMKFFQKALMDYSTVLLLEDTPNIKVLQNRGLLYLEINDAENALEDFKAAAKVSSLDAHIRHALGYCYHKLNRLEEAVATFNDALELDPFFVEAYNSRGNALMDYGHEQGNVLGRRDYLKALHINPKCLSARVNLAYNLQVEGKYQKAWNQFSAAIAIDNTCQAALEGRAVINLQMSNTFGALVDLNDAIKISKTAELLNNRGVVHQFMNDYVNAVRDYQAAIRLEPSYALSYYNAGNIYFKQRQFKQALTYYDRTLSWTPDDESAVLNRAITKVLLRDSKGAIQDFNKAVELNPYAAHVYFNRGNLYASLRKYKEAEEDYTRALSLCPGDALVYKKRADVLGKQSKKSEAIEDYKKAIIIKTRTTNRRG